MAAKIVKLVRPAEPNIVQVLEEFLADQRSRLRPKTVAQYESVLHLLRGHLDGYGHESLSAPEAALFNRCYNAEGSAHREYSEVFGPEKILENLGGFLGYFMVRKVIAGGELLRAAGTVTKKLSSWLAEKGYAPWEATQQAADLGASAGRDLPHAERAASILHAEAERPGIDVSSLAERDYLDFDHFTIARVEPGRLWLEVWEDGEICERGPIRVPETATELLRVGWSISCSLACIRRSWRLLEVANVYPG